MISSPPCRVKVVIPHFCRPSASKQGYGSTRVDAEVMRSVALARCLGAVLGLARGEEEEILAMGDQEIRSTPLSTYPSQRLSGLKIDCHVFVTGDDWLSQVISAFGARLTLHHVVLDDPRRLPHAARRFLLEGEDSPELSLYLEDDLVIHDRLYCDKILWFLWRTEHQFALMPHRFEHCVDPSASRLFVDGPLLANDLAPFQNPQEAVAKGRFWDGQEVSFDVTTNPHSGSFALSRPQLALLRENGVPDDGFVGPLETVATYTVLKHFPVLKPSWQCRDFLAIEHGHPSFLFLRKQWPRM